MADRNLEIRNSNFDRHIAEFSEKLKTACEIQKDSLGLIGFTKTKSQYSDKAERYQTIVFVFTILSLMIGAFVILGTGLANTEKLNWFGTILTYGSLIFTGATLFLWVEGSKQNRFEIIVDPKFKIYAFGEKFWYYKTGEDVVCANYGEMDILSKTLARDQSSLTFKTKLSGTITIAFSTEKDALYADDYLCKKILESKF